MVSILQGHILADLPRLRAIDLNLLPILRQLLLARNVTRAAQELAMSQPAVSKALARLRATFDDPLLVRDGRGYMLTPRAERLLDEVDAQCRTLERLWTRESFDPESARRSFTIAATDYEALVLLPEIAPVLRATAPAVSIAFRTMWAEPVAARLGKVDIVIGAREALAPVLDADAVIVPLWRERFVTVVANGNTATDTPRRLTFHPGWALAGVSAGLPDLGPDDCYATVPTFTVLPLLAFATGSSALVPHMVARRFADHLPINIVETADAAEVNIVMAWHPRWQADPGHRWLRELIRAHCPASATAPSCPGP